MPLTKVAYLLSNPVSDLVKPDCLNFHFSWNENLKEIKQHRRGAWEPLFFETKMTGFRRAPLAFFSLLEERLHEPDEIIRDKDQRYLRVYHSRGV